MKIGEKIMKFCTECGNKLGGDEKFCSECGHKLGVSANKEDDTTESQPASPKSTSAPTASPESVVAEKTSDDIPSSSIRSSKENTTGKSWPKSLVLFFVAQVLVFIIILIPAIYMYEMGHYFYTGIWALLGSCIVFSWRYRKPWVVNIGTTLIPMIALVLLGDYQVGGFYHMAIYGLGETFSTSNTVLYVTLGLGILGGIFLGTFTRLYCEQRCILAPALRWNILLWVVLCVGSYAVAYTDWHSYIVGGLFLLAFAQSANLFGIHGVLLIKRYLLTGPKLLRVAAALVLLSIFMPLTQENALAQTFSEGERQEFKTLVMKKLRPRIEDYMKRHGWWGNWSTVNALNKNNMRTDLPDRLFIQYALDVGTRDDSPTQSGHEFIIKMTKFTQESFAQNALGNMANQQIVKQKASPSVTWVKVHTLGISGDSLKIEASKPLPSGREYSRVELMMSYGRWVVYLGNHSGGYAERGEALLRAIAQALSELGERDGSATWEPSVPGVDVVRGAPVQRQPSQVPSTANRPSTSGTVPSSTVSGSSTGSYYSPTPPGSAAQNSGSSSSSSSSSGTYYSPTSGSKSYNPHMSPDSLGRSSLEMSIVMLLSSALVGLGGLITGGGSHGKSS